MEERTRLQLLMNYISLNIYLFIVDSTSLEDARYALSSTKQAGGEKLDQYI